MKRKHFISRLNPALTTLLVSLFSLGLLMIWPYGVAFMEDQLAEVAKPPKPSKTVKSPIETLIDELETPTPTEFPQDVPTEIPTETPIPTVIPTEEVASPTPFPTEEPSATPTELLPLPTSTPEPTNTRRPTRTPTITKTPKPTRTPTQRSTLVPSPTRTPITTRPPILTRTALPSRTPVPTRTPIPPEPTEAMIGTFLTVDPVAPVPLGKHPNIVVHLKTLGGRPVVEQSVALRLGGVHVRQARTDANGMATLIFQSDLPVGTYTLEAVFNGARSLNLAGSSAAFQVEIVSTAVEIKIIPPLPGINFKLADRLFTSDENGMARIDVTHIGVYPLELLPLETGNPGVRLEFIRWADSSFSSNREVEIPLDYTLELGLALFYQVSLNFVDRQSQLVPPERITEMSLKGSDGALYSFTEFDLHWLQANRVARRVHGLEVTPIQYSVESVMIDGSNVVNSAQQRFYLKPNDLWVIQALLYSAHFSAHDAFMGFPMGTGVRLQYPDGHTEDFAFGPDGDLQLPDLARGLYRVTVLGVDGQGLSFPTPIALSRDQTVSIPILSFLDLTLGSIMLGSLALALLFTGRPHLLQPLIAWWPKLRVRKPHA